MVPRGSTRPARPTPAAAMAGSSARSRPTRAATAASTASGPTGVGTRCSATISPLAVAATPRTLVPPTSMPAVIVGTRSALEAEQGADAAEDVEVGALPHDLDPALVGQRLFHRLFDDVVDELHRGAAVRAAPPPRAQEPARPAPPTRRRVAVGDEQHVDAPLHQGLERRLQAGHAPGRPDAVAEPVDQGR